MPVILATWEDEIRKTGVPGQHGKKKFSDPISTEKAGCGGVCL
jgi:hypothetical protein